MTMEKEEFYLVILGDGGVGKTAIAVRYTEKSFTDQHWLVGSPTIENTFRKELTIQCGKKDKETKTFSLEILDSAGQV